jgi:hypothetical protein
LRRHSLHTHHAALGCVLDVVPFAGENLWGHDEESKFCRCSVLVTLGLATAAQAADTITFNLTNSTGRVINKLSSSCLPAGSTCSIPSSISNGTTGTVKITSVHGAGVGPQMIARYGYSSGGTTYSCQLTVSATKSNVNSNVCTGSSASFLKTGGTASAPTCSPNPPTLISADNNTCTYVYSATMQ